jgi:hypothetical protein
MKNGGALHRLGPRWQARRRGSTLLKGGNACSLSTHNRGPGTHLRPTGVGAFGIYASLRNVADHHEDGEYLSGTWIEETTELIWLSSTATNLERGSLAVISPTKRKRRKVTCAVWGKRARAVSCKASIAGT